MRALISPEICNPYLATRTEPAQMPREGAIVKQLIPDAVTHHLTNLVPKRPAELARMERVAARTDFPIIGPIVGQLCYLLALAAGARRIFELGSGFGYSTAWFARAVQENGGGEVHHVVWDEELSARARKHLASLELDGVVRYTVGEAVQTLGRTQGEFDLIFNDINK